MGIRYTGATLLPELLKRLAEQAPDLDIHTRNLHDEKPQSLLAQGDLDLVLQPGVGRITSVSRGQVRLLAPYLYAQRLYTAEWVGVVRKGHPTIKKTLDLQQYTETPHILISLRGDPYGFVDTALDKLGRRRRVALLVQNFVEAFMHVAATDYVLTSHLDVALAMRDLFPVKILKLPIRLETVHLSQVWHERTARDPLHRWLRQTLWDVGKELGARYRIEQRRMRS